MPKGRSYEIGFRVRGGRMEIDRAALEREIRQWPDCDGVLTLDLDEAQRSSAANRYLFGVVYEAIIEHTGQSKEDVHDEMCARFTSETITRNDPRTGRVVSFEVVRRTSGMKVSRFHKFVQDVKLFGSEFCGVEWDDEPEDMRQEYQRAVAREQKKGAAA